jgi:hypothetical protein
VRKVCHALDASTTCFHASLVAGKSLKKLVSGEGIERFNIPDCQNCQTAKTENVL